MEPLIKEGDREGDIILNEFNNVRWLLKVPSKVKINETYELHNGITIGAKWGKPCFVHAM